MSDIIEGLGTAAEGGLFSRALEPDSGAREPHPNQPENCLNCGTPLIGAFCHACGQKGHLHRTIGAFMHELLHGALHFEGKFWRTFPMLAFRPGTLTRRYIEGERARFVSPMALFLFSVFLMFAAFQMAGITAPTNLPNEATFEDSLNRAAANASAELESVEEQLADPDLDEATRANLEEQKELLEVLVRQNASGEPVTVSSLAESFATGFGEGMTEEASTADPGQREVDDEIMQVDLNEDGSTRMTAETTGVEWFDSAISKWRDNPGLMLYKMQTNAYKFSWLLIPISIPFVWLLFFWKRRFKAYDHAIFITYSLSFVSMLFIAASLLGAAGVHPALIITSMILISPLHMYKHLRGTYQIGRFSAFWRLFVLSSFIWIIVALFLQLLLLLGAF